MKTQTLIENLSRDLKQPSPSQNWFGRYWFAWLSSFALMAVLTYIASVYLPEDIHLPGNLHNGIFWFEVAAWFLIAVISALVAYSSSLPGRLKPSSVRVAYGLAAILFVSVVARWSPRAFAQDMARESHLMQGPCGVFITLTGLFSAMWMFTILKRAAPVRLGWTGAWSAASVGALGSMFMHLVCTHESSVHLFIWHMLPLILLIGIASMLSQRVLRW